VCTLMFLATVKQIHLTILYIAHCRSTVSLTSLHFFSPLLLLLSTLFSSLLSARCLSLRTYVHVHIERSRRRRRRRVLAVSGLFLLVWDTLKMTLFLFFVE
jgi:hypothetical protein